MYKIDTIFYFCDTQAEYDAVKNIPEGTESNPEGIDPRTIVFIHENGAIYKNGQLYGRMKDEVIREKIETIIKSYPETLPIATSDTLGAIKVGNSLTMVSSTTQDGPKDTLEIKWSKLIEDLANYTDNQGTGLYKDQWIKDIVFDSAKGNAALKAAIDALGSQVNNLDTIYATDSDLLDKINTLRSALDGVDAGFVTDIAGLRTSISTEHNTNETQNAEIADIKARLNSISAGEEGVSLDTLNSRVTAVESTNEIQTSNIATNRADIDSLVSRLNADIANLAALATRVGANETDIASLRTLYENLNSWLASDSELQEKLDALKTMLQNVDTGMLTRLTDLEAAWNRLDAAVNERLKSADYETEMAAIRSALDRMIDAGELASLEATLRELINNNKIDADTKISTINSTLSQITESWVIRTISSLFTDWEFVKSLDTNHIPMAWEPRLQEFIQVVVNNMSDDENSAIWSMFEQKYNELLTKIEGITVLNDGEGAISIDQLVAIIKSYIDTANFESVNEMKTFWAKIKAAYEDKEIDTNDPEWLKKLEEILKNYETYEWVVAGFESRSGEEMNLAQQFAQAQAKNTEHDTAIYQHGQRLTDDEARLAIAEGDIDALEQRASTIETNLNAEAAARTSAITDLEGRVSSAESSIGSHTTAIEEINTEISTLDGKVTANETNIATLTSDASLTSNAVSDLKTRMTTAENNLSAKADASNVYTKTEIDGKVTTINNSISGEAELRQAVENDLASYKTTVTNNLGAKANVDDVYSKTDIDGKVSTINTNVTAASNLAQEAKNDFSNWKNDETDGYKAFTTSTSNALTSKASVSYVDGIKDNLQGQIDNLESGVTTSSDIQGWLNDGTLKLNGNTAAEMYSKIGNVESAVSTKAEQTTVTNLAGEVSTIQSTQSSMQSTIAGHTASIATKVTADDVENIVSGITISADNIDFVGKDISISANQVSFGSAKLEDIIIDQDWPYVGIKDGSSLLTPLYFNLTGINNSSDGTLMLSQNCVFIGKYSSEEITLKGYVGANYVFGSQAFFRNVHTIGNLYMQSSDHIIDFTLVSDSYSDPITGGAVVAGDGTKISRGCVISPLLRSTGDLQVAGSTTLGDINITGTISTKVDGNTLQGDSSYIEVIIDGTMYYLCFVNGIFVGYTDHPDTADGIVFDGIIDDTNNFYTNTCLVS